MLSDSPRKGDREFPLFDYERQIFQALEIPAYLNKRLPSKEEEQRFEQLEIEAENRRHEKTHYTKRTLENLKQERLRAFIHPQKVGHLLVLKSAGLGLTTFFLRYIAWLCLKDDKLKGQDIIIITGPREQLSIDLITRLKKMFLPFNIVFDTRETTIFLNGVRIRSFPSNNLSAARGIESLAMCFLDEAAFFGKDSQSEVLDVVERYAGKSQAKIVLCSTPNRPGDLVHSILSQPFEQSFYKILKFDYTWGLGKIYTDEDIRIAKASDSFAREYNLQFAGVSGNVISSAALTRCQELGEAMDKTTPIDDWRIQTRYVMGIDMGYGSSNTAITVSRFVNGKVQIIYSKEFARVDFRDLITTIWDLKKRCPSEGLQNILLDASGAELYTALCHEFNQNPSPQYLADKQAWVKQVNGCLEDYLFIVPIPFSTRHQDLLGHLKWIVEEQDDEDGTAMVAIHPTRFTEIITALRTAQATENRLDKSATAFDDTLDSLRINLSYYRRSR